MGRIKRIKQIRLHREGIHTLLWGFLLLSAITIFFAMFVKSTILLVCLYAPFLFVYLGLVNFFRCPIRLFGKDTKNTVVAPADGRIVVVEEVEENEYFQDRRIQVSIFMSIINVHANWFPVDGFVKLVKHEDGAFLKAYLPKSSTDNERTTIVIETPEGKEILVRQIAGAMARRIVTYAKEEEQCYIDEHLGFIKFGSRVDLFLPLDTEINVSPGQLTIGNNTIIGKLK